MVVSASTLRSRSQDSPTLWLSVLAGSLALHLVLLLAGRWYLSQTASDRAGSPAPLDFVEIDPNAPPLKQPVAPKPATANSTPRTSAAPETATPAQSQEPSIQSLARQATPERSQSQAPPVRSDSAASPRPETKPDSRSSSGNFPTNPTQPTRPPATTPTSAPSTQPESNPSGTTTPGSNSSGTTTPGNSPGTTAPGENPGATTPENNPPGTTAPGATTPGENPSNPASSGTILSGNGAFGGLMSDIQVDPNARQDDPAESVTFKITEIPQIELPIAPPKQPLDLRVLVEIDNADGTILEVKVLESSPTPFTTPKLKEDAQAIAYALLSNSGPLFNVVPKFPSNPGISSRIIRFRVDARSIQSSQPQ